MPMLPDAERIGIFGRSGSGKSALTKQLIRPQKRVIVFDPMDEYRIHTSTRIVHDAPDAIDKVRRAMLADPNGFKITFVPSSGIEAISLHHISSLLWRAQEDYRAGVKGSKKITLVVEEMNLSFPIHGETKCKGFANICSRGRASGIEAIGTSQGIAEVSTRFRRNCSQVYILAQADTTDRKAAANILYMNPKDLEELQPLEYIYRENSEIKRGIVDLKKR